MSNQNQKKGSASPNVSNSLLSRLLLENHLKSWVRTKGFQWHLAGKIFFFLFIVLPALLGVFLFGYFFDVVAFYAAPETGTVSTAGKWVIYGFGFYSFLSPLGSRGVKTPVRPLIHLPISKRLLVNAIQTLSFLSLGNLCFLVFLAVFWSKNVLPSSSILYAGYWLGVSLLLLLTSHLWSEVLRILLDRNLFAFALSEVLLVGALLADFVLGPGILGWAGATIYAGGATARIVSSVAVPLVFGISYFFAYKSISLELYRTRRDVSLDFHWTGLGDLLPPFGRSNPMRLVSLDLKLLFRNNRARFLLLNVFVFSIFGASMLLLGLVDGGLMFTIVGAVLTVNATVLGYTAHSFRLKSTLFDYIASCPISPSSVLNATIYLSAALTLLSFVPIITAVGVLDQSKLPLLLSLCLYSLGISNQVFAIVATYETSRFDPSLSAFSTKGAMVSNGIMNNAFMAGISSVPVALMLLAPQPFGPFVYLPLGSLGLAGLLAKPWWVKTATRHLKHHKYNMLAGFRNEG